MISAGRARAEFTSIPTCPPPRPPLRRQPRLKILYTTGYARNAIVHHGRLDKGVQLITKPFSFPDLAAKVRDVLDDAS